MPQITYPDVWNVISKGNRLFIPYVIEQAILDCIPTDNIDMAKIAGDELQEIFKPLDRAITLDYNRDEIVNAYSLYYLRRNTLIPRIAIRDMVLNTDLQQFPENMRVLDLGSGTGAVTLGLLEMFLHPPFNQINITVDSLDKSMPSLIRLKQHQIQAGLSDFNVNAVVQDLNDISALDSELRRLGPYDLIFAANVFNELDHQISCDIIRCLSNHLKERALITIVNAQRDFTKILQPKLVTAAVNNSLYVYYPCPTQNCSPAVCWFWREHDYDCQKLRSKGGQFILSNHRDQLVATWLILCNKQLTIFDDFKLRYPGLGWGVFRIYGKDPCKHTCEVCTSQGIQSIGPQTSPYKRGAIVGYSGTPLQIQQYLEL